MSTMQNKSRLRRRRAGWYLGIFVAVLAVTAQVLYSTGAYDSWRNARSVDRACGGLLAQGGLPDALQSSQLRAEQLDSGHGLLTDCMVKRADSGADGALTVSLQWSKDTAVSTEPRAWFTDVSSGVAAQAAPLGAGWPGIVRNRTDETVMVTLDCQNAPGKALIALGVLINKPDGAAPAVLTGLGRVTAETAQKAAATYGCHANAGARLKEVNPPPAGSQGRPPAPLDQSRGSCAALRGLAPQAARNGVPQAMEYPADSRTPQVNCYLVTDTDKPGYGVYAFYGAAAKAFRASGESGSSAGPGGTNDRASATATCPGSTEPAAFLITRLREVDMNDVTYPVPRYSPDFANAALKAFADNEAKQRGCSEVRMVAAS
ncbi:hypothetical protein ABZX93_16975 [Streptomyces sp. NPDC006632]|uniref:hypothetical protein n=1 Tax=Streptomyces sp. NPDC006632 TaxID=3157182 RepID=UPI0033A79BBF